MMDLITKLNIKPPPRIELNMVTSDLMQQMLMLLQNYQKEMHDVYDFGKT